MEPFLKERIEKGSMLSTFLTLCWIIYNVLWKYLYFLWIQDHMSLLKKIINLGLTHWFVVKLFLDKFYLKLALGLLCWLSWWRIYLQCRRPWFDPWVSEFPWRRDRLPTPVFLGFPGGLVGKESVCNETWVWSLGWEDPLEKGMATHSSIFASRIPWTKEPGRR